MFRSARAAGLLVAVAIGALVAAATTATAAPAPTGSPLPSGNACANPVLARDATGWSATSGGPGSRVPISGHVAAAYGFRMTATATLASMALPAQAVRGGQRWTFAADSLIRGGGQARLGVDWYDAASRRLAHADGAVTAVSATVWTRVPLTATAPAGAVRVVVTQLAGLARGSLWSSTACAYTAAGSTTPTTTTPAPTTPAPTTTTAPPTTTTTTPPPTTTTTPIPTTTTSPTSPPPPGPGDGTQAATRYGWGTPTDGDEFDGTSVDRSRWYLYNGKGHNGNGVRSPQQISVSDGVMTMSGTANGTTGGMSAGNGYLYGRWETRMRVPRGDSRYHPVLLLWPDAEDWPTGGEVDYAETDCAATDVDFYLHYSAQNRQTHGSTPVDLTQWHNYAVEWTPSGIRGYVDGVVFFTDTTASHLPPRSMHQTIQLDWFPSGSTATTPSSLQVAWTRYYPV